MKIIFHKNEITFEMKIQLLHIICYDFEYTLNYVIPA